MTPAPARVAAEPPVSTLPARQPGTHHPGPSKPAQPLGYDLGRAWDLLAGTSELPATQQGLIKILAEYRKALHALATRLQAIGPGHQDASPEDES